MRKHGEHIFLLCLQKLLASRIVSHVELSVLNKRYCSTFCKPSSHRAVAADANHSEEPADVSRRLKAAEKCHSSKSGGLVREPEILQETLGNSESTIQLKSLDLALSECLEENDNNLNLFNRTQYSIVNKDGLNNDKNDKLHYTGKIRSVSSEIAYTSKCKNIKKRIKVKNVDSDALLVWGKDSHPGDAYSTESAAIHPAANSYQETSTTVPQKRISRYSFKHVAKNVKIAHKLYKNEGNKCKGITHGQRETEIGNTNTTKLKKTISKRSTTTSKRFNDVNIEMLPQAIGEHLFGAKLNSNKPTPEQVELSRNELQKHNLLKLNSGENAVAVMNDKGGEVFEELELNNSVLSNDTDKLPKSVISDMEGNMGREREKACDTTPPGIESLKLPPLLGKDIEEHFWTLGEQQAAPYRSLLLKLVEAAKLLPRKPQPSQWQLRAGWTCYGPDGRATPVDYPPEDALVFDVEVCCEEGVVPTLAVAAAPESQSWYGWVSQSLAEGTHGFKGAGMRVSPDDMIPLDSRTRRIQGNKQGKQCPRVVVAHHAAFDRARVREQYSFRDTGLRFVDTLSLHVCVSSVTDEQRMQLRAGLAEHEPWSQVGSLNALQDIAQLYCPDKPPPEKSLRDVFVKGSLDDIRKQFPQLMDYCAGDVFATLSVLEQLLPLFFERFPHPVTLAGMLELGTAFLPVDDSWNRYIMEADATFEELDSEIQFLLAKCANTACELMHNDAYQSDTWMWDQDWSLQELKLKQQTKKSRKSRENETPVQQDDDMRTPELQKEKAQQSNSGEGEKEEEEESFIVRFERLAKETAARLPARPPHMPGYPAWYRKLCSRNMDSEDWSPGPQLLTTGMQITPKLLRLSWEGYPLHFLRGYGWGFLLPQADHTSKPEDVPVPMKEDESEETEHSAVCKGHEDGKSCPPESYHGTGVWTGIEVEGHWFMKLPHKDGASARVGNPLSRDFMGKFAEHVLTGDWKGAQRVLEVGRMLTYWRNNRDRVLGQIVTWHSPDRGVLLPQVIVCGTLTRRAVEPTWMTASNARSDRVGSELRAMVRAPPGYCIVGADVDSQELWIAALLGDAAQTRIHGGTPLGWMTLAGKKKDGTDMHSVTAKAAGITRDQAKVLNYARIYGAGSAFAERVLQQFNPGISESEARSSARRMFSLTKGRRLFRPLESLVDILGEKPVSKTEALRCARRMGKPVSELFHPPQWEGGTESAMFNRLEEIACSAEPRTPFLSGRLTRALEDNDDRTLPTRVNWVVQSGAVDFLHLLLVSLRWLLPLSARFCLSFHDEVRYLVPERDKYRAATAMHISNLMARAFCSSRVGMYDLPLSVAFFSSVEVDRVLRKEASDDCVTPSNPHGLSRGYGIPPGESLDLITALQLCNYKPWTGLSCVSKSDHNTKRKKREGDETQTV
ncbi:DNA polymerase subunit gamma-1, mitochondrial [Schistocerca nitens]|uniref:DNA polymerase subunit gamma-1, mitochondrial n=1 Tax=Schistocerca nitens TaxID=7011 RepID=UPI002117C74D|nr:DNA polymerase subunit gamma-1, mitochondrial [Schistocerca nitens]